VYARVPAKVAFPDIGVGISRVEPIKGGFRATLWSSYPDHQRFERRVGAGPWLDVGQVDTLPRTPSRVEYRSLDRFGNTGMHAVLQLIAPGLQ
jgi:hypothetical protein